MQRLPAESESIIVSNEFSHGGFCRHENQDSKLDVVECFIVNSVLCDSCSCNDEYACNCICMVHTHRSPTPSYVVHTSFEPSCGAHSLTIIRTGTTKSMVLSALRGRAAAVRLLVTRSARQCALQRAAFATQTSGGS